MGHVGTPDKKRQKRIKMALFKEGAKEKKDFLRGERTAHSTIIVDEGR